jgi:peptide/nickel transport system substrate-binding protein
LADLVPIVQDASAQADATVVLAIGGDPTSLDPLAVEDGNERSVNDSVYETLVTRDAQEKIIPWLAESWTQPDSTTYR